MSLLDVRDLRVGFQTDSGLLTAVDGVSFKLEAGRTLGIVGESGCGKSVTARALMRLLEHPSGRVLSGEVHLAGRDLLKLPLEEMRRVRGKEVAMIFQEPMTALNPVHRVGKQIIENLMIHHPEMSAHDALRRAVELMKWVGIPAPDQRVNEYPHQLSGGMRQRVMIAMALSCSPKVLIADEPSTALDVTVQAQILDLINRLQSETGMAVILITHDLGVVAETCDDVAVMYAGRIAERGPVGEIFARPLHPYTRGLMSCLPKLDHPAKTPLPAIPGNVPSLREMPEGCRFGARSGREHSEEQLRIRPPFVEVSAGHSVENCPACVGIGVARRAEGEYDPGHDHRSSSAEESSLESALRHLRAGESTGRAASGDEDRAIRHEEQLRKLAEWARSTGRLIPAERFQTPVATGAEHKVFFDEKTVRALKVTNTGLCGQAFVNGEATAALPSEYLERWRLHNQHFGDSVEFEGVMESPSGFGLVISQPWITGEVPSIEQIETFMTEMGYEAGDIPESYRRRSDGMRAMDCHDGNFILDASGALLPIDVILIPGGVS